MECIDKNMITVVNKKKHTPTENDVYIGRGSVLGNPFTHLSWIETKADFICESRHEAIERYKTLINDKIKKKDKEYCAELNYIWTLAKAGDINLVCYCKPQSCHGDIIKSIIESKL